MTAVENAAPWNCVPLSKIEDLSEAVQGAGLETMQMSRPPLKGSLAFASHDGVAYSTGHIGGQVALTGCLSESLVTLGVGLELPHGSKQWLNDVTTGNTAIFLPGAPHDALYMPGSLYATATLTVERLEEIASDLGLVLTLKELAGSGVVAHRLPTTTTKQLRTDFKNIHWSPTLSNDENPAVVGKKLLRAFISQLGRVPRPSIGKTTPQGYGRIACRARTFILDHLDCPLSIDVIAANSLTSQRTLHRAFLSVFNETPYSYVQKIRLNRIRSELITDAERACTIKAAVQRWGISELGRFAGLYNELFGELPSETLARRQNATPCGIRSDQSSG